MADPVSENARPLIFTLPDELIQLSLDFLPNRDIKNVRLSNRRLKADSLLRFDRVFISPNKINLGVLRCIIEHKEFSRQVQEIVWDDALLECFCFHEPKPSWASIWYDKCHYTYDHVKRQRILCEDSMTMEESMRLYQSLYEEQQAIISSGEDIQMLRKALDLLPALKRVTITPATWGPSVDLPRYHTPLLRALPATFDMPIPRGWPDIWSGHDEVEDDEWAQIRQEWRGLTIVLHEMVQCRRSFPELVLDVGQEETGIPHQFFIDDSEGLQNFQKICSDGLQRLDLPLHVAQFEGHPGLERLPSSRMKATLANATSLREFSLRTNRSEHGLDTKDLQGCLGLLSTLPVKSWPHLRRLSLSNFPIIAAEFIAFLDALPSDMDSVHLVNLRTSDDKSWRIIVQHMKDGLSWRANQPTMTLGFDIDCHPYVVLCTEAFAKFFAGEGINPVEEGYDEYESGIGAWARHPYKPEEDFEWK